MIITPLCQRIIVRYARKPIWYPTAPSKLFRISDHTFYSHDEIKQIRILRDAYKAQERTIQEFMKYEFYIPATQSGGIPKEFIEKEAELDEKIYQENDQENLRIAKLKEEMLGNIMKKLEENILEVKLTKEEHLLEAAQKADDFVREHKDNPNSFVTPDNIEMMIERAMENITSYEYCIDRAGRRYKN